MEAKRSKVLLWATMAALLSQNLVITAMAAAAASFEDQKNYYTPNPDPHTPTPIPPIVPHPRSPPTVPRSRSPPTPHHGGGGTPPAHCGNTPSPSGGHRPKAPSSPTGGGGGYYRSPPPSIPSTPPTVITPPVYLAPPSTPIIIPGTPSTPTIIPRTPTTPIIIPGTPSTPTIIPRTPTTPIIIPGTPSTPLPPFPFDPNSPPFPCIFWRNHPTLVWGLVGWWGTLGNAFGIPSLPGIGAHANVLQALSNTRTDGLGDLYREGTAALLNSMAHTRFPYTTNQVRDSFIAALRSNQAAASQARLFKLANEGRTKA